MLRASDLLSLTVGTVQIQSGDIFPEFSVRQQKTNTPHVVSLFPHTQQSLKEWIDLSGKHPSEPVFTSTSNRNFGKALSRMQYSRLVKEWAGLAGRDPRQYSTHSMRRTKAAVIYGKTKNLRVCQLLLGHRTISSTAAYLAIDQAEAIAVARTISI